MKKKRLIAVQKKLLSWHLDALLITTPENIRYLSGFTGSSGVIIVTPAQAFFFTDSRYVAQSKDEVIGFKVRIYKKQINDIGYFIDQLKCRRIGFEEEGLNYAIYRRLKGLLKGKRLVPVPENIDRIRGRKDSDELNNMEKAAGIASVGFDAAMNCIGSGAVERDVALDIEVAMKRSGAEAVSFDIIVASGARAALPHGKASDKKIRKSELVIVDLGARYKGYHSDETCTFIVGRANREQKKVYQIVKDAHDSAIEAVRPGIKASYIDSVARDFIRKAGYGKYFGHGAGHGIGLAVHEWPNISPYSSDTIEEGMVFTVEPGIYIPCWGGVRIEDMVFVTRDGCRVLTKMSKELKSLGV